MSGALVRERLQLHVAIGCSLLRPTACRFCAQGWRKRHGGHTQSLRWSFRVLSKPALPAVCGCFSHATHELSHSLMVGAVGPRSGCTFVAPLLPLTTFVSSLTYRSAARRLCSSLKDRLAVKCRNTQASAGYCLCAVMLCFVGDFSLPTRTATRRDFLDSILTWLGLTEV